MTIDITDQRTVLRISADERGADLAEAAADVADGEFATIEVGSTGVRSVEPLVSATHEDRTAFYAAPSAGRVADVAADLSRGVVDRAEADAVVEHDPETASLPAPAIGGLDAGTRRVLGGCGWRRPTESADHAAAGGFRAADDDAVMAAVADLDGRGWGDRCHDEPVADVWRAVREGTNPETNGTAENPAVVVNAHGNAGDRLLCESAPFEVLEGAMAAARVVDAEEVVVYVSTADERAIERVREASENYPDPDATIEVVAGPTVYRAAEPTMALEAIEGNHRLEARLRPPGPEEVGLFGRPTLVHTARTLAQLAIRVRDEGRPSTRLVTVDGAVRAPATVELSEAGHLDAALDAVEVHGELKAACIGGRFGGLSRTLSVPVAPDALSRAGLGTEGEVEILTQEQCMVEFVGKRAQFATDTNCGRCVPCREGTTQLTETLRDVYDGEYDTEKLDELIRVMERTSICEFGVNAGRPTRTAMNEFEAEFRAHAEGECPTGSCTSAIEATH